MTFNFCQGVSELGTQIELGHQPECGKINNTECDY